eukprot:15403956-Alexandrium_andersonii.AAC.1
MQVPLGYPKRTSSYCMSARLAAWSSGLQAANTIAWLCLHRAAPSASTGVSSATRATSASLARTATPGRKRVS